MQFVGSCGKALCIVLGTAAGAGMAAGVSNPGHPARKRPHPPARLPASFGPPLKGARVVVFKKTPQVDLRLHVFQPPGHTADKPVPAVVFFFGGGWAMGGPGQFQHHARYFASRGMVAICAEYRVSRRHGTTPFECVADGKSAIRYVREHAAELGVDPDRIVAAGGSAGGHVALSTAVFVNRFDEPSENLKISSRPNALCLFNPVVDTTETGWRGGAARLKDRCRDLSPIHHLPKDMPPTIIFHGSADTTVPVENIERLQRKMHALGARCEVMIFQGEGHGFFNYGRKHHVPYIKTVRAMDRFLESLGYLRGEPTLALPEKGKPAAHQENGN